MEQDKLDYFRKIIEYIKGDLESLLNIELKQVGACNFPIALYIFSCMDFLGYLISEEKPKIFSDTEKRIFSYINSTFEEEDKLTLLPFQTQLVEIFRNGLTHEFFPKNAGISRKKMKVMWWDDKYHNWVLDVDLFAEMFIKSLECLLEMLKNDKVREKIDERFTDFRKKNIHIEINQMKQKGSPNEYTRNTRLDSPNR